LLTRLHVLQKLKSVDTVPIGLSTAASIAWLRDNRQKWRDVIAQTKIQIE
jgi:hypothetical protein